MTGADILNANAYDLMLEGDYPRATYYLRRALDIEPKNVHARNNLATCLKQLGREDEAIKHYEALLADEPDFLYALNNLAFSYLRNGRYAEGWKLYHMRRAAHIKIVTVTNPVTGKPFLGEPLPTIEEMRGKDILLVLEQGIGDELFFLRFVPRLVELAQPASVWYAPGVKLYPVLAKMDTGLRLTDTSYCRVPKENAVAIPLADLPLACGHDGTWFPPSLRLTGFEHGENLYDKKIGVTWRAGDRQLVHKGGLSKMVPPEQLGRALHGVDRRVVVMQRNPTSDELYAFKFGFAGEFEVYERNPSPSHELLDLIEKLSTLSEYVGVSNTDMYLLGLIGRTARTLVVWPPEWRWAGSQAAGSPWFPGYCRYHQDVHGWGDALERLRADLVK